MFCKVLVKKREEKMNLVFLLLRLSYLSYFLALLIYCDVCSLKFNFESKIIPKCFSDVAFWT